MERSKQLAILIWNNYIARPQNEGKPVNFSFEDLHRDIKLFVLNEETFNCRGCGHNLPMNFQMKTEGYCYLCDPEVSLDELLKS